MKIFGYELIKEEGNPDKLVVTEQAGHVHDFGRPKQWVLDNGKVVISPKCRQCGKIKGE